MAKNYFDSSLLDRAIMFAVKAHANTERRGKGFPYIVHPLEAIEIVSTITSDQELLAAAVLHDVIEDTDCTEQTLRSEFGDRIADLVVSESDVYIGDESSEDSWHRRKHEAINRILNSSYDSKVVAMGDKLSNMRAIARDYARMGDSLWNIFHEKRRSEHEWHYRGLAMALGQLSNTSAYKEFVMLLETVFSETPVRIDLAEYKQSGEGYMAISYNHNSGDTMIKLYNSSVPSHLPQKEYRYTRKVYDMGLKTPRALRFVTDGTRYGVEFERITPKQSFSRIIADHPERLEETARTFALICRRFHSMECDTTFFPSHIDMGRKLIADSKLFTDEEKEPMYRFLDRQKKMTTCLHGDMHIGNVIESGGEIWWIDMPDFSYGDPRFDLGVFYLLSHYMDEEIIGHIFHMPLERFRKVWDVFIREYLGTGSVSDFERELIPFAALTMVQFSNYDGKIIDSHRRLITEYLR